MHYHKSMTRRFQHVLLMRLSFFARNILMPGHNVALLTCRGTGDVDGYVRRLRSLMILLFLNNACEIGILTSPRAASRAGKLEAYITPVVSRMCPGSIQPPSPSPVTIPASLRASSPAATDTYTAERERTRAREPCRSMPNTQSKQHVKGRPEDRTSTQESELLPASV